MMRPLRLYSAYKDSGVEWLGDVPEHWTTARLKSSMNNIVEQTTERRGSDLYVALEHVESWTGRLKHAGSDVSFDSQVKRFRSGDILFGKLRPYLAKVTRSASGGVCVGEFLVLRPRHSNATAPYMEQLLRSKPVIDAVNSSTFGAKMPRADWQFMGGMAIVHPPLPEQAAIVRFLDHADRRIRRYIRTKQKLIALLEEQKQAIIHQAVTGQVDVRTGQPYPAYKPSGVEWLGDVPEHWEVRRVKSLSLVKRGASPRPIADPKYFDDDGEYAWVRIADVTASSRYLERTTQRLSVLGQSLSVPLEPGALFLSIAGSVGKPMITRIKCCIHDGFVYFPQFNGDADFLYRVFASGTPFARLGKLGTQLNLNTDTVGNILLGWPPSEEQAAIVSFLDQATADLDTATTSTQRETSLLSEYRTRLIADVVTGKLDVRTASAWLPDEVEEQELLDETDALIDGDEATDDDLDTTTEEAAV